MINKAKKESNKLEKMISEPYHPPPLFYEKKSKLPPEKTIIIKS